jgi:hypothetical protein
MSTATPPSASSTIKQDAFAESSFSDVLSFLPPRSKSVDADQMMEDVSRLVDSANSTVLMTPLRVRTSAGDETEVSKLTRTQRSKSVAAMPSSQRISPSSPAVNYPLTFANSVFSNDLNLTGSGADMISSNMIDQPPQVQASEISDDASRVSAYARLDFETFTFYVQTLQVILGRRVENGNGAVDVHLGSAKAISRKHAKIFYNFGTQRFELSVMGRNGAFVGEVFVETDSTVPLDDG